MKKNFQNMPICQRTYGVPTLLVIRSAFFLEYLSHYRFIAGWYCWQELQINTDHPVTPRLFLYD